MSRAVRSRSVPGAWFLVLSLPAAAAVGWWLRGREEAVRSGDTVVAGRELPRWPLAVREPQPKVCLIVSPLDPDRERCRREAEVLTKRLGLESRGADSGGSGRFFLRLHVYCFAPAAPWDPGLVGCALEGVRRDGRPFHALPIVRIPRAAGSPATEIVRSALSGGDCPVEPGTSRTFLFAAPEEIDLREVGELKLLRGAKEDVFEIREHSSLEWEGFLGDPKPGGPGTPTVANTPGRR